MYKKFLMAYICLNTIYCFPEIWDKASGNVEMEDYRHTGVYQFVVRDLTSLWLGVLAYPHRYFFGIKEGQFNGTGCLRVRRDLRSQWKMPFIQQDGSIRGKYVYGKLPFDEFLALEYPSEHVPGFSDVIIVRSLLCSRGIPMELALAIMDFADYTPKQRLKVPRDPFHPSNRDELNKYLTFCWLVLVRCDMIAKEVGRQIDWREAVTRCVDTIWDHRRFSRYEEMSKRETKGMVKMVYYDDCYTWEFA